MIYNIFLPLGIGLIVIAIIVEILFIMVAFITKLKNTWIAIGIETLVLNIVIAGIIISLIGINLNHF